MASPSAAAAGAITIGGDLTVNRLGLGTNRIRDDEASRKVLRRAIELGVNFVDTADVYGEHVTERVIGSTLAPHPPGVVIATKGGMVITSGGGRGADGSPTYLENAVAASLARLKRNCIDLYFLHRVDSRVPLQETMSGLRRLQDGGKIGHIGLSSVSVAQIEEARKYANVAAVQNSYNISDRAHEQVLDYCEREQIPFVAYYPLRTMKLADRARELEPLLQRHSATPRQLALAWLLKRSPVLLPIPGTLSVAHLEENVAAAQIELSPAEMDTLARLAA
jgi:aryl-alcohol dehydrogenase-like predicted oxidoreductase